MTDVAVLGIKVDSRQVLIAAKDLDKLTASAIRAEKATDGLTASATRNRTATGETTAVIDRSTRALDRNEASTRRTTTATNGMATAIKGAAIALGAIAAARGVVGLKNISDEAVRITNRLRQVTDGVDDLNATFKELSGVANRSRSDLSATSVLFKRLTISTQELGLSQRDNLRITETITKALKLEGATAQESSGAIRQLSQGLASGALRGDEFNSVAEQASVFMRAISKETGIANGDLRDFAATGGITSDIVIRAVQSMEEEVDKAFAETVRTFDDSATLIRNGLIEWAKDNDNLTNTINGAGAALLALTQITIALLDPVLLATSGLTQLFAVIFSSSDTMKATINLTDILLHGIGFLEKAAVSLVQAGLTPMAVGLAISTNAFDRLGNAVLESRAIFAEYISLDQKLADSLRSQKTEVVTVTQAMEDFSASFDSARMAIDDSVESLTTADKVTMRMFFANEKASSSAKKLAAAQLKLKKAFGESAAEIAEETMLLGLSVRARKLYLELQKNGIEASSQEAAALEILIDLHYKKVEALEADKKATKELEDAQKKATKQAERDYRKLKETVSGFFVDLVGNGKNAFQDLGDLFKKMLVKMVADFAASKILKLLGSVGGGSLFSAGASAAGGGGGGIGNLVSAASGIKSLFTSGAGLSGILGGGGAVGAAGATTAPLGYQLSNIPAVQSLTDGLTAAAPWASALAGALDGFAQSGIKGAISGGAGGFLGAKGGAALGTAILPGIGTAIGAVLGGILGGKLGASIFGGKWEAKDLGINFKVATGDLVAESFKNEKKKGGLFSSTKSRTVTESLDTETVAQFNLALTSIKDNISTAYAAIGATLGDEVFKGFSSASEKISTKGKTEEEINALVTAYFGKLNEEMTAFVTGGLLTFDELVAVGQARTNLIGLFTSEEEKLNATIESLGMAFASIGEEIPTTDAAMLSLVKGLDLTTQAGLDQFAVLNQLGPATKQYVDYLAQLNAETEKANINTLKALSDSALAGLRASVDAEKESLRTAFDADIASIQARGDATVTAISSRLAAATANARSLSSLVTSVQRAIAPMTRAQGQAQVRSALSGGSLAGVDLSGALSALAKPSAQLFSSFTDYQRDLITTNNALVQLEAKASDQLSTEERTVLVLTSQLDQAKASTQAQIAAREAQFNEEMSVLDLQVQIAQDQLNAIRGVDTSILTLAAALGVFNSALGNEASATGGVVGVTPQTAAGITSQVEGFYNTILNRDADAQGLAFYTDAISSGRKTTSQVRKEIAASEEARAIPAFANGGAHSGGLRLVGERGPELESTGRSNITSNADLREIMGNGELVAEIRQMREDNRQIGFQVANNTRQVNRLLQRWDGDGMPPVRAV